MWSTLNLTVATIQKSYRKGFA
jgi:hypothetical protein